MFFKGLSCRDCKGKVGCEEDAPVPVYAVDGENIFRCPLKLITEESYIYMRYYRHYKNGFLPVHGGLMDQATKFLKAMAIIDSAIEETRRENAE